MFETERDFEKWCRAEAQRYGYETYKMDKSTREAANGNNWPDLLILGSMIMVELKMPKGRLNQRQRAKHKTLEKLGCKVYVVRTKEEFIALLK